MENDQGTWFNLDDVQYIQYLKDQAADAEEEHPLWRREEYRKSAAVMERAIQSLEHHGVPRERIRTISNGIDAIAARNERENMALLTRVHLSTVQLATANREIERLRLLLEQKVKQQGESVLAVGAVKLDGKP